MTDREKLIELLCHKYDHFCDQCGVNKDGHYIDSLADYLIANGVTFAADNNVGHWIPVSERFPDSQGTYLCRYGFGQFADYMTTGCIDWIAFDKHPHWQHASTGLFVTHWMPLPEPPKTE